MKKVNVVLLWLFLFTFSSISLAQLDYERKVVKVPKVAAGAIVIDGKMDDAAWSTAVTENLISSSAYNLFTNQYYRSDLTEPDYDEIYTKLAWSQDTLYVFIHIDEIVNDSDLVVGGKTACSGKQFLNLILHFIRCLSFRVGEVRIPIDQVRPIRNG